MTTTRHRTAPRLLADPGGRGEIRFRGADLIEEVRRADLRGHGGGGFPTWRKMRAVADGRGRRVVVANGTEGEPASRKDETLLAHDPDLVIDGALAAAEAVGADEVVLAVARDNPAIGIAADAVARRPQRRGRRLSLAAAPPRFVTGEESALVGWLNGGPAVPTITPPRPSDRGVRRRPTLVQNVETLAHVALIARHGADWFREAGTPEEPGTTLVTIGGAVRVPGVHEVALGTPLGDVLAQAGGPAGEIGGVLTGGYSGAWLETDEPWSVPLSAAGLRAAGGVLGTGTVMVLPGEVCPFAETARLAGYLAGESAGQCGPCVFGLPDLSRAVAGLASGRGTVAAVEEIREVLPLIERRGACAHPDGVARLVRSAVRAFPGELDLHMRGGCSGVGWAPAFPVPARAEGRR